MSNSLRSDNLIMLLNAEFLSLKLFLRITSKSRFPLPFLVGGFFSLPYILCVFSVGSPRGKFRIIRIRQKGHFSKKSVCLNPSVCFYVFSICSPGFYSATLVVILHTHS